MKFLKALSIGLSLLVSSISYAQNSIPNPPRHLLGVNELALQRFTNVWVKYDKILTQYIQRKPRPLQQLPAYSKPQANVVSLLWAKSDSGALYKEGFLINATNDTAYIDRADATIAHIRTEVYTKGEWLILQKDRGASCGNSYWTMALAPNHYILVQLDQLEGSQTAPYRIIIKANGKEIISEPTTVNLYPALLNLAGTTFTDPWR